MKREYVIISLITHEDTTDWKFGRRLFEILCAYPKLQPEWVGEMGLNMQPFGSIEAMEPRWAATTELEINGVVRHPLNYHWWERRKLCKTSFSFRHPHTNMKNTWSPGIFKIDAQYHKSVDWREVFDRICALMKPKIGMLHIFTKDERPMGKGNQNFPFGTLWSLDGYHPYDFGWMYAGGHECYADVMNADLSGTDIIREDFGLYATLQVAKGEDELFNDFSSFAARREELKKRLPIVASE